MRMQLYWVEVREKEDHGVKVHRGSKKGYMEMQIDGIGNIIIIDLKSFT